MIAENQSLVSSTPTCIYNFNTVACTCAGRRIAHSIEPFHAIALVPGSLTWNSYHGIFTVMYIRLDCKVFKPICIFTLNRRKILGIIN